MRSSIFFDIKEKKKRRRRKEREEEEKSKIRRREENRRRAALRCEDPTVFNPSRFLRPPRQSHSKKKR